MSRLTINLLIGFLILALIVIIFILIRSYTSGSEYEVFGDDDIDLKISQVKQIDDSNLGLTLRRNFGEGSFSGLSFIVYDGVNLEIIKLDAFIEENDSEELSLYFNQVNASRIKSISVSTIYTNEEGLKVTGGVKDEYITPDTCSNYCPPNAQCGITGCGLFCGSEDGKCKSGYSCVNYKCVKDKSSSGSGEGGGSSGSGGDSGGNNGCTVSSYTPALNTFCGSRSVTTNCGTTVTMPGTLTCQTGYSCAANGTCVKDVVVTCNGVTCKSGEYCSNGVCLENVTGNTYFVATNGNDNWNGSFTHPWKTWQKAVQVSQPGDITYFRGGVWQPANHIYRSSYNTGAIAMAIEPGTTNFGRSGTANAPIRYYNYPGETPIMDGILLTPNQDRWQGGIGISNAQYIYFKGLTIRNIFQSPPDFSHGKPHSEVYGISSTESANLRFENMVVYNVNGRGFQHWSGAWNVEDGPGALFDSDNTSYINCDAYNLFDRYSNTPGNAADGWYLVGYYGSNFLYEGCRAWNYSDDGFNTNGAGYTTIKNCWAISGHEYDYMGWTESEGVEGNGFKTTCVNIAGVEGYELFGENFVKIENSIVADCSGAGIITNLEIRYDSNNCWPSNALVRNNFAYRCEGNFWDSGFNMGTRTTDYRNNIAYQSTDKSGVAYGLPDPLYEVGIFNPAVYPHSNNTWKATSGEDWPGWEYNPAYTVTDDDFISLDFSQLKGPRKADFSLPDVDFGKLKQGSDLIDAGVVIPGYHCTTSGAHPGQNCREWYGSAPDLGPFESNY